MPDSAGKFRGISVSRVWPGHPDYEEAWEDLGRREAVRLCESIAQELAEERLTTLTADHPQPEIIVTPEVKARAWAAGVPIDHPQQG